MHVEFAEKELETIYQTHESKKYGYEVIRGFVRKIELIKSFQTEHDFGNFASLGYEKLRNYPKGTHSIRINLQRRIIFNIIKKKIVIIQITELSKHYQ
ncbi:MAG: type II toxin-antitoxin system RelE/ParE family toxin [Candidatus Absconditabacterales bacterium]